MSSPSILADAAELAAARPYAERSEEEPGWHDAAAEYLLAAAIRPLRNRLRDPARRLRRIVAFAARHEDALRAASDAELRALAAGMRARLRRDGFVPGVVGACFALVREAASRTLGKRHYPPQLMAGWALLQGKLVEMETGEGKTLAATLPACTVALAGLPVHVITVNDYLAARDAEEMGPLYRFLGLSVGVVVQGMEPRERRAAYACDDRLLHQQGAGVRLPARSRRAWRGAAAGCTSRWNGCAATRHATRKSCCAACTSPSSTRPTACSSTKRARR